MADTTTLYEEYWGSVKNWDVTECQVNEGAHNKVKLSEWQLPEQWNPEL